jgi:hypothetical protein
LLVIIFAIIADLTLHPLFDNPTKAENEHTQLKIENLSEEELNKARNFFTRIFALAITGTSVVIFTLLIISQILKNNVSVLDFIFIRPFNDILSIRKWFYQGMNSVPVYLTLVFLLQVIILILFILNYKSEKDNRKFSIPQVIQEGKFSKENEYTGFQSVLLFGGWFIIFFYLLINVLYSALSSVPDPSSLLTYPEESDLFIGIFIVFILFLILTGTDKYQNDIIKTIKSEILGIDRKEMQ